ncbi:hypothetical protein CC876_22950 [Salmonella enterica subsp. enterica serovar Kisarawe]|nr:hypothetical protein [Salmonella enterica subsp. enterica serovar Infantis]EDI0748880.1 hypothetical protein [Salmonella enterica subsp. enterica serovar Kisarawe]EDI7936564.1 hypothetical protein [Salmonella enterica]EDK4417580.1 hypothetical protein [Salmonella enterica]EDK8768690.1 hypothetical protein [Salmonella enterica]
MVFSAEALVLFPIAIALVADNVVLEPAPIATLLLDSAFVLLPIAIAAAALALAALLLSLPPPSAIAFSAFAATEAKEPIAVELLLPEFTFA